MPTLDAIADRPELAQTLPPAARAAVLTRCASVLVALAATDILTPITLPLASADRLLDVAETARRLDVSEDYVYRHAAEWPFTVRRGRKLGFSEHGLATYLQNVQQQALPR